MVIQDLFTVKGLTDFVQNYTKELMIAGCCLGAGAVGIYFYHDHYSKKQEQAQIAFSQTIAELLHPKKDEQTWANATLAAKTGYRTYKNSSLAPYFLALEAEAQLQQNNIKEGINLLQDALNQMGSKSPFYYLFKTKLARIKLDVEDLAIQTEGFNELKALAEDTANKQRDEALYYLGEYYASHDDAANAHEAWQKLINEFAVIQDSTMSPWAALIINKAQQK